MSSCKMLHKEILCADRLYKIRGNIGGDTHLFRDDVKDLLSGIGAVTTFPSHIYTVMTYSPECYQGHY